MAELSMYVNTPQRPAALADNRPAAGLSTSARNTLKSTIHQELIRRMDLDKLAEIQSDDLGGRQRLLAVIFQLISEQSAPLSAPDRDRLAHDILDEVFGLGPLEPLLHDATVSDILVNTHKTV